MRPEGFYWVRTAQGIEPARWDGAWWTFCGDEDCLDGENTAIEVLAPCLMPAVGPE